MPFVSTVPISGLTRNKGFFMTKFNEWILQYYGMLMDDFLSSELSQQVSFADLANAFQAGELTDKSNTISYVIVDRENGVLKAETLTPELMMKAHKGKVTLVMLTGDEGQQWYDPQRGWLDLLKEETEAEHERSVGTKNKRNKKAISKSI